MSDPRSSWARVQLIRGTSGGGSWAIDGQYPEARLSIGSAPDAGWPVHGVGVMPVHFELFWDGQSLWIADTRHAGGVTIHGRAVAEWLQIRGRVEVSFGSAAMSIETSEAVVAEMASNPGQATRVTLAPEYAGIKASGGTGSMNIASTMAAPAKSWDDSPLADQATRVAPAPSERPGKWGAMDPETTRIAPEGIAGFPSLSGAAPVKQSGRPPAPPQGMMRPRLGGAPPGDMARTIAHQDMTGPVAEAARMAVAHGVDTGPSVVLQPGYPASAHPGAAAFGAGAIDGGSSAQPASMFGGGAGGPGASAPSPLAAGGFAAPPTYDQTDAEVAKQAKRKQAIPTRTWIMLSVTVLAAAGLMMMGPAAEEEAPVVRPAGVPGPLPTAAVGQPGAQAGAPIAPQVGAPIAPIAPLPIAPLPIAPLPIAPIAPIQPLPVASGDPAVSPVSPVGGDPVAPVPAPVAVGPTPDRVAADLVILGRWDEALPHYQALAAAHPERPEYLQMVRILQRRLTERCQGGIGPDGRPCGSPR